MIQSKEDYLYYLEADRLANNWKENTIKQKFYSLFIPDYLRLFHIQLRRVEYYKNCKKGVLSRFLYLFIVRRFYKLSRLNGFCISANCFGPGLSIAHSGTIVVNSKVRVGKNCRIHTCVNIGTAKGSTDKVPILGDNCYIGPGVKIFGEIKIADHVTIGANAVVNQSVEENHVVIAGIPAKIIAENK